MHYYSTDERKSKIMGGLAAFLYVALWVIFMIFVTFTTDVEPTEPQGIMLDIIGDPGDAASQQTMAASQTPVDNSSTVDILTQDFVDAPAVVPTQQQRPVQPQQPVERPRQADPNALFRPSTTSAQGGSTSSPETGQGQGGYSGTPAGTGGGGVDSEYSVGDRSLVGSLPPPSTNYGRNKQGKVVVEIFVNEDGVVTQATYRARGSTTTDSELVRVAREAALKARFTRGGSDIPEVGTITYTFNLQ